MPRRMRPLVSPPSVAGLTISQATATASKVLEDLATGDSSQSSSAWIGHVVKRKNARPRVTKSKKKK